ncbi:MAG: aldo/keto reductase, partial [Verrucomicrobia bacterium]|nr:aldo/keto reductase [Verrucomicrobiota bacterium]
MKYRILGKTDLRVSVVGVGTWQFGGEWGHDYTQAEVDAIIGEAGNQGINLIDTAECYGDHLSEKFVGQAIAGKRDAWIVATKFGHQFQSHLTRTRHWQADDVRRQLEDSLRALQTDYVDLYQCHSASNDDFDNRALWKTLRGLVESGKVRHLGISLSPNTNMYQTKRAKRVGAETIQIVHNRLSRQGEADVLPACQKQNLGVLARVPLASGYLSGKYKPGATFPKNDVRGGRNPDDEAKLLREVEHIAATEVPPGID